MQTYIFINQNDPKSLLNCLKEFNQTYSDIFEAFKVVTGEELIIGDQTVENSKKALDILFTMVVISSGENGVAKYHGGFLGQYEYDEDKRYYTQTSTAAPKNTFTSATSYLARSIISVMGPGPVEDTKLISCPPSPELTSSTTLRIYLYPDEDDIWWVGLTPGKKDGWMRNPTPSKSFPRKGWHWTDGKIWYADNTLVISPGQLPPLPTKFMVRLTDAKAKAKKFQDGLGVYTKTERWWLGRPVYKNMRDWRLCHGPGGHGWMIGPASGEPVLSGFGSCDSPVDQRWRYWECGFGTGWTLTELMVTEI